MTGLRHPFGQFHGLTLPGNDQSGQLGGLAYQLCSAHKILTNLGRAMENRLREIRLSKGLTLADVAEKTGTSATQISRLETGRRKLDLKWINKLSTALEVEAREIVGNTTKTFRLVPRPEEVGPEPKIIRFLSICHEMILEFIGFSPPVLQEFMDHRQAFKTAVMLTASFLPLFEKVGLSDELRGTLAYYIAHIAVTEALKAGNPAVEKAAIAMRDGSFAFLDPDHDELGKRLSGLNQKS